MSAYVVTANLDTIVAVRYTGGDLTHGKWKSQPGGIAPVGTTRIFEAQNRDGSTVPPEGWASFIAADGTRFTFRFADPVSEDNHCSSAMDDVHGPYELTKPDYPTSGKTWTVTFHVKHSATVFFDAPVFVEDLIAAPKCDDYPAARMKELIGERICMRLRDVFATDLPSNQWIWCATHPLFLTPFSKAVLARDLAEVAARRFSHTGVLPPSTLDDALQAHRDFLTGAIGTARLRVVREALDQKVAAARANSLRDAELIGVISALTAADPAVGWAHAVQSYLGRADDLQRLERSADVVDIIKARL